MISNSSTNPPACGFGWRAALASLAFALVFHSVTVLAQDAKEAADAPSVKVITNSGGMKLALIPSGKFAMGSPRGEADRESQEVWHDVVITKPFYVGVYEVTQREWQAVSGTKQRATFDADRGGSLDHPMDSATWP